MFHKYYRIVIANGRLYETFYIMWRGRHNYFQPWKMGKHCRKALRVLCRSSGAAAHGAANDHRHFGFSAKHISIFCPLIYQLVHSNSKEVKKHDFCNRPHTAQGSTNGSSRYSCFRYRSINYPVFSKFLKKPFGHTKGTTVKAYIFAYNKDIFITK